MQCETCKKEFKPGKTSKGRFCARLCYWKSLEGIRRPPRSLEWRKKLSDTQKGIKSHFWKGGVSVENKKIRAGIDFRLWREAVFARDNWTCQECKVRGGELHPHHIKPFAIFPELRFA